jgi:hypothetical protein
MPPVLNRPLWLERADTDYPGLAGDLAVDFAVIGAGITGATAAYLLARAGRTVALLESSRVCFGATGYTTAKLTVGHGLIYADLADAYGPETARRYARSNQDAIEQVAAIVAEHAIECDLERTSNVVYVERADAVADLGRELEAARAAGTRRPRPSCRTRLPLPSASTARRSSTPGATSPRSSASQPSRARTCTSRRGRPTSAAATRAWSRPRRDASERDT